MVLARLRSKAHVVCRIHWRNTPLHTAAGKRIDVVSLLRTVAANELSDWPVYVQEGDDVFPMRLIAIKKSKAAAEREKKHIRKEAKEHRWRVDVRTLAAADYIYILTDLPREQLPGIEVLELYRLRWQIELVFKRLKSLLKLDNLRAKSPQLSRTYILSKILGALMVEEMTGAALSFFPWGYRLPRAAAEPVENAGVMA